MRTTEAVRWLLDRHKISIVEWNKRSGISRQQIHNWLNTKVENVRPQSLEKLAGAVGYKCEFEGNEVSLTRVKEIAGGNEMIETISYKYMTMLEGEVDRYLHPPHHLGVGFGGVDAPVVTPVGGIGFAARIPRGRRLVAVLTDRTTELCGMR